MSLVIPPFLRTFSRTTDSIVTTEGTYESHWIGATGRRYRVVIDVALLKAVVFAWDGRWEEVTTLPSIEVNHLVPFWRGHLQKPFTDALEAMAERLLTRATSALD